MNTQPASQFQYSLWWWVFMTLLLLAKNLMKDSWTSSLYTSNEFMVSGIVSSNKQMT